MNKRKGIVDFWRLVFALLIMAHHTYLLGRTGDYPFQYAWIYVEFFFMLTGYFTTKHFFRNSREKIGGESAKESISYTVKKYKDIFPYIFISVSAVYFLQALFYGIAGKRNFFNMLENFIREIFMLTSAGVTEAKMASIWYLSAMFLVLPLFCYFLQNRNTRGGVFPYILSWFLPIVFYGKFGVIARGPWPNDILRAFVCLCIGNFIYIVSERFSEKQCGKIWQSIFTLVEAGCFLLTILLTAFNVANGYLIIFCFVCGLIIVFSGQSFSGNVQGKIFDAMGRISLLLYLFHWPVGLWISYYHGEWSMTQKLVGFYASTFMISLLAFFLEKAVRSFFITGIGKEEKLG